MQFSTKHIDYLERSFTSEPEPLSTARWATPVPGTTDLLRLRARSRPDDPLPTDGVPMAEMTDVLIGLHAAEASFIFAAIGDRDRVSLYAGTSRHAVGGADIPEPASVDAGPLIQGVCPGLETSRLTPTATTALTELFGQFSCTAAAVGTPSLKPFGDKQIGSQMDRIRRSLQDCNWGYIVCALPISQAATVSLANRTLNEIRIVSESSRAAGATSPVGDKYVKALDELWEKSQRGKALGLWHTALFLLAEDGGTLEKIKGAVRAVMSGTESVPDPFAVVDVGDVAANASAFAVPLTEPPEAPGQVVYPYRFLSLLNSLELATLAQAPRLETPGFHVFRRASFDVNPHGEETSEWFSLGDVIDQGRAVGPTVVVEPDTLRRHVMVAGTTGSGKTNTVFHLLQDLSSRDIPFLVIEPVKSEYRCLGTNLDSGPLLQVFTPGREGCAPLRLNPFEVQPGLSVGEHVDLLRAAFSASFGLWTPLPQVLEQSLHAVYRDKGWDLVRNSNRRVGDEGFWCGEFPTLTELVDKVRVITERLGYSSETTDEIRSALITRLNALRIGGKGRMLDVERSLPADVLFSRPTVIELEGLGADEDKAFVMALIMIQLAAFRRRGGLKKRLEHLLVIEEAHRLLANVSLQREERAADPRGRAVETFVNLLAEIRAYGEGVVAVDQVPVKLAPDLIKNTNLKIAHRIVAETDRMVLGGAMIMDDDQERALATLKVGEAAVFGAGDDGALLVRVPLAEGIDTDKAPTDEVVGERMQTMLGKLGPWATRLAPCGPGCSGSLEACETAASLVDDHRLQSVFGRLVLSSVGDPAALDRMWPDLLQTVRLMQPKHVTEEQVLRCLASRGAGWLSARRGARAGWSFADTRLFGDVIRDLLLARISSDADASAEASSRLENLGTRLWDRPVDPFPRCGEVCGVQPSLCPYRHAVADQIESGRFNTLWGDSRSADRQAGKGPNLVWQTCMDAAYELIEFPESDWSDDLRDQTALAARRTALCFGQQMYSREVGNLPRTVRASMDQLLREARHG